MQQQTSDYMIRAAALSRLRQQIRKTPPPTHLRISAEGFLGALGILTRVSGTLLNICILLFTVPFWLTMRDGKD